MTWIDRACAFVAASTAAVVAVDADVPGRPIVALLFVLVVPGWTILRISGVGLSPLAGLAAVMLSISFAMVTSMISIELLGWTWQPMAVVTALVCVVALLTADLSRRPSADAGDGARP